MSTDERDRELCASIRTNLDRVSDQLDEATLKRLRLARMQAVESVGLRRKVFSGWMPAARWITAGGTATVVIAILTGSVWFASLQKKHSMQHPDDVEIVAVQEQIELYEDLEFYRWLAQDGDAGAGRVTGR